MKRVSTLTAAVLLAVFLAACGSRPSAEPTATAPGAAAPQASAAAGGADALMEKAGSLAMATTGLEGQLWEGHLMMALTAPDAATAGQELANAGALLDRMTANEKSIAGLLDQVARLDASDELTTYAGQQKEIAELRLVSMASLGDTLAKVEDLLQKKGALDQADLEKLFSQAESPGADDPLARLEEKGQASREFFTQSGLPQRYYINNGLGEAYDTPNGQTEEEAGAFPFADGISFEGPMVSEESPPAKIWGSFDTTVAEAMQAQRGALEDEGWTVSAGATDETRGVLTARNSYWRATLTFEKKGGGRGTLVVRMSEL